MAEEHTPTPPARPITDQEAFWDEIIMPHVAAIHAACNERNLPFFLMSQLSPEDENGDGELLGFAAYIPVEACPKIKMVSMFARNGIDAIVTILSDVINASDADNKK